MLQTIQKFGRALRRDYLPATPQGSETFTFAKEMKINLAIIWGVCGVVACALPSSAPLALLLAAEFSPATFFLRLREIRKDMQKKETGQIASADGGILCLSGPGRNVCLIENTQKLIGKVTAAHEGAAELPAQVRAKLEPYIGDGAAAAMTINASLQNQPQAEIPFLRRVFNGAGEKTFAVAAAVLTPFGIEKKRIADHKAAVAAAIRQCQTGLPAAITIRPLRLKTGKLP